MSEGIDLSQQPLFVPAAAGWYACPGDPPGVTRHWDGKQWLCEIRGPIREHFDYLRAMSLQGLSPDDQAVLRQLTHEVSTIEDLALAHPTANPPLVQIAAPPPYVPPPIDPYTSVPLPARGMAGSSSAVGSGQRFAPSGRGIGKRKIVVAVIAVVGVLAVIAIRFVFMGVSAYFAGESTALTVNSCVTLSSTPGTTDSQNITWTSSTCTTAAGAPVSYTVVSKLTGTATCDPDSQYVQSLNSSKAVAYTYCLMKNLTAGACLYEDPKGFYFDVACADARATMKVTTSVDQGSGFTCPDGTQAWQFPAGNRTYCLTKP